MKIIHTFDPVPSRVIGLLRVLRQMKEEWIERTTIVEILQPAPIRGAQGTDPINEVIGAAIELGIVLEDRTDRAVPKLRIAESLVTDNEVEFNARLPRLLAKAALIPECEGKPNQFARACAWLVMQDPMAMPQGHGELKRRAEADGLSLDELGLKNDQRWDMLLYWAMYLGLAWQTKEQKCFGVIPDPSTYLLRHLDELLTRGGPTPIHQFRDHLGLLCPVLDGGTIHRDIAGGMRTAGTLQWKPSERLSGALSFALRYLKATGAIHFWCPDDQRTFLLMSDDERIAYISRRSEEAA
jgi:hypothetical protein